MTPIYVIHCTELPERTEKCRQHLMEKNISATFWRSYHGKTWGIETTKEYDVGQRISPGHVGLNLGTWGLWQHIWLTNPNDSHPFESSIIFEDDVEVPDMFQSKVMDLQVELNYLFREWDLVFLGLAEVEPHVWNKVTERIGDKPDSRLCRLNDPFGTHAYMVRRKALPILLDKMTVAERNLDQQLWERVLKPGHLKWCAVLPSMVRQRTFDYVGSGKPEWSPSTIENGELPKNVSVLAADEQDVQRMCGAKNVGGRPTVDVDTVSATSLLVDPFPCIYRGEFLDDMGKSEHKKSVPLSHCARLGKACHSKSGIGNVIVQFNDSEEFHAVESCEKCEIRTEMPSDTIRPRLPLPEGHFNPSIALWNGEIILATRDSWGHSKLALWKIKNENEDWTGKWQVTPIGSFASEHAEAPRLEDPRLFTMTNPDTGHPHLCAMLNLPDGYPPKRVQVGYVRFARDLSGIETTEVFRSPNNNLYEKNWAPFFDEDGLHWIYSTKPDHVVLGQQSWSTPNPLPWVGGVIRGGASPVLESPLIRCDRMDTGAMPLKFESSEKNGWYKVGSPVYYHFFHGCLKRFQGSVYTVGCCVFESRPPYKVLRQTKQPLLWPDLPAVNESVVKRYVMWPGGAIPHKGHWHIAVGIDDTCCRIIRLPFEKVDNALKDVPETNIATSIRDTPLARGIPSTER